MAQGGWGILYDQVAADRASAALVIDVSVSAPRAARVDLDAADGFAGNSVQIPFPAAATQVRVRVQIRPHDGYNGAALAFRYGTTRPCTLEYFSANGDIREKCEADYREFTLNPNLTSDAWTLVTYTLERGTDATLYRVSLVVGSTLVRYGSIPVPAGGREEDTAIGVAIGNTVLPYVGVIDYDDVQIEVF